MTLQNLISDDGCNQLIRGRHGWFLINKNDVYIGHSLAMYGEWSEQEVELFQQVVRAGDTVVEVGANIGPFAVPLAKAVGPTGTVHAFEPQRIVHQILCANIALNSLFNVECHLAAVGEVAGSVVMAAARYDRKGNFGGVGVDASGQGPTVPQVTLDEFLDVPQMRLLKIDVEGMEQQVLLGARETIARCRPAIYVENDRMEQSYDLITLIRSMEYDLFWHVPRLFNPQNIAGEKQNVFGRIVSVNMIATPSESATQISGLQPVDDPYGHPLKK